MGASVGLLLQGVMLSHAAVISEVAGLHAFLKQIGEGTSVTEEDVVLSYLPLAHIFDRCALVICSCPVHNTWNIIVAYTPAA